MFFKIIEYLSITFWTKSHCFDALIAYKLDIIDMIVLP